MTTTIMNINIDDMDTQFVEDLKRDFAHAAVEIRVQEQQEGSVVFSDADFWKAISLLDWSKSDDDDQVVALSTAAVPTPPTFSLSSSRNKYVQ